MKVSFWLKIKQEFLEKIVKEETSLSNVLMRFGFPKNSTNSKKLESILKNRNIDITHFRSIKKRKKYSKEDIFCINSNYKGSLKYNILKLKLKENKCQSCKLEPRWNNAYLSLQIDHINGISNDNRIENLRILCPNCHSQTETFGSKNHKIKGRKQYHCRSCKKHVSQGKDICKECHVDFLLENSKFKISTSDLKEIIQIETLTDIAKRFGVTANTVKKRCKKLGIWSFYKDPKEAKKKEFLIKKEAQKEKNQLISKRYQEIDKLNKEGFSEQQICEKVFLSPRRVREIILDIKRNKIKL